MVSAHLVFVLLSLGAVLYSDHAGLSWIRGKKETLNPTLVERLHLLVSVGLAGVLLTGGLMFIDRAEYLLSQPVFLAKMGFVAALVINGFFIGQISRIASEQPFRLTTPAQRRSIFISGAVSALGWLGALILGFILSFS